MVLLGDVLDDGVDVLRLDGAVVGVKTEQMTDVVEIPGNPGFFIAQEVMQGGLEALLALVANGHLVVLVEHDAQNPVGPGAGAVVGLGLLDLEGRVVFAQHVPDQVLDFHELEIVLGGDDEVVGIAGIDVILLAKIAQGIEELVVDWDHHEVGDERGDLGALRQAAAQKSKA